MAKISLQLNLISGCVVYQFGSVFTSAKMF